MALWITQARSKGQRAPFSLEQWAAALRDDRPSDVAIVDETKGWAKWSRPNRSLNPLEAREARATKDSRPLTIMSQDFPLSGNWVQPSLTTGTPGKQPLTTPLDAR